MSRIPTTQPIITRVLAISWTLVLACLLLGTGAATAQWTNQSNVNTVVSTATSHVTTSQIAKGPSNGTFVLWSTLWGTGDVYLQFVNSAGYRQPNDAHVASNGYDPVMVADGAGGVIVVWRDGSSQRLLAQRYTSSLATSWSSASPLGYSGWHSEPAIIADGAGGAIVSWTHQTSYGSQKDIRAQQIDASGWIQWSSNGYLVVSEGSNQNDSHLALGGAGDDAFVVWEDVRAGYSNRDIWGRYIDPTGSGSWSQEQPITNAAQNQFDPMVIPDGSGGAVIAWTHGPSSTSELLAQRIDSAGLHLWTPWNGLLVGQGIVHTQTGDPGYDLGSDGNGGAVLAWSATTATTSGDIRFQRLSSTGAKAWGNTGLALTSGAGINNQKVQPALEADGSGGAVVAWATDAQVTPGVGDIYAQYVDPSTGSAWQAGGLVVSDATDVQHEPDVVSDGECPAKITWSDHRNNNGDVYMQRIKCPGTLGRFWDYVVAVAMDQFPHALLDQPIGIGIGGVGDPIDFADGAVFELAWDPTILQLLDVVPEALPLAGVEIDAEAGNVRIEVPPGGSAPPDSTLFSLVVQGVAEGSSALAFTAADAGPDVFVSTASGVVTVDPAH